MQNIDSSVPRLDSDLLRTFLTVAQHRNVSRAAEVLHRTQSATSVQIKRLESLLGTRLFVRGARGVTLSPAGERLHPAAERIVRELDRTAQDFLQLPLHGPLRIGIPDDYGSNALPAILSEFAALHPDVEISVRSEFGADFEPAVARGDLDLAITAREVRAKKCIELLREPTVWAGARGFVTDFSQPLPVALFDRSCWWRDAAIAALTDKGIDHRIVFTSESVSGVKAAISSGLAVGMLSRSSLSEDMQVLGRKSGLPALPPARICLLQPGESNNPVVEAMARAIRGGFARLAP